MPSPRSAGRHHLPAATATSWQGGPEAPPYGGKQLRLARGDPTRSRDPKPIVKSPRNAERGFPLTGHQPPDADEPCNLAGWQRIRASAFSQQQGHGLRVR